MYATVREYEGVENPAEAIRQVTETFLPMQREIAGFISYYFVDVGAAGGRMLSMSVFQTEEGSAESNRRAAAWVADHPNVLPTAKLAEAGPVVVAG